MQGGRTRKQPELPGGPVLRTSHFHCRRPGFNSWERIKIQATWPRGKKSQKQKIDFSLETEKILINGLKQFLYRFTF